MSLEKHGVLFAIEVSTFFSAPGHKVLSHSLSGIKKMNKAKKQPKRENRIFNCYFKHLDPIKIWIGADAIINRKKNYVKTNLFSLQNLEKTKYWKVTIKIRIQPIIICIKKYLKNYWWFTKLQFVFVCPNSCARDVFY